MTIIVTGAAGYAEEFDDVATGVRRYVDWLADQD